MKKKERKKRKGKPVSRNVEKEVKGERKRMRNEKDKAKSGDAVKVNTLLRTKTFNSPSRWHIFIHKHMYLN